MAFKITLVSFLRFFLLLSLLAAIVIACFTLPIEQILKDFLVWIEQDLGPWGPLVLAAAYIPLTILAVPASILTEAVISLACLWAFFADSLGATLGAGAAFLLGRTIGKSYVTSKLKDHPQFDAVAIAIKRSGFKIVLLLRLVPVLSFNMLNYLLSVTPIPIVPYLLASWLGMMPITLALVYAGTTLKDLSDVTHGWSGFSKTHWAFIILSLMVSVVLMIVITRVAKAALDKAMVEHEDTEGDLVSQESPALAESTVSLHDPLVIKVDNPRDNREYV